jgi:hypothetical protein
MAKHSTNTAKPATPAPATAPATTPATPAPASAPAQAAAQAINKRWVKAAQVNHNLVVANVLPNNKRGASATRYTGYTIGQTVAWHIAKHKVNPANYPHIGDFKWDVNPYHAKTGGISLVTAQQWAAQNHKPAPTSLNLTAKQPK